MQQGPHIEAHGVAHEYAAERGPLRAVDGVDLEIGRGVFASIIGPSGGGKTTLLRVIGGLLEPTEGTVRVGGLAPGTALRRREIGFVFQDPSLLPWRTVRRNVALPYELNGGAGRAEEGEAERLVHAVGLAGFEDYYPHELSGGMRQRVAFARALALDPPALLMDEPLGALDEMTRGALRHELLRVWEMSRKTVLLITHSIAEAVMMSDWVAVMSARPGRILRKVTIDLPRPREEALERSERFIDYVQQIREILSRGATSGPSAVDARCRA